MRFQDMPYERIDFAKVQEEMGELIRELEAAKSGHPELPSGCPSEGGAGGGEERRGAVRGA